ncbi:MAG: M48 family metalloprotease [Desulfovibrio sp.]|jgi:putative metalloprotease|nr:M48 family metalloprotease [Desulfovibrio sp.]
MKLLTLFLAMSLALAGCTVTSTQGALDAAGDAYKAAALTDEEASQLAKELSAAMDAKNQRSIAKPGSKYDKRLQSIVAPVRNEGGKQLNFKVYMTQQVNAFAMADGSIRVFSGLMDLMDDNELLFVIGHEIGHVVDGDSADQLRMAYATSAARKGVASTSAKGGGAADAAVRSLARSELGALAEQVINAQFSQSQESDADKYGLDILKKLNKDTGTSVSALQKLAKLGGGKGSILSSHPDPADRAEKMERLR